MKPKPKELSLAELVILIAKKREAALEFIEYVAKSGAASPLMLTQLRLAARMWAYEQGADDDLHEMQAENMAALGVGTGER